MQAIKQAHTPRCCQGNKGGQVMTSFNDLDKQYKKTLEYLSFNLDSAANSKTNPSHAIWLDHPTLVRWLCSSSREFVQDFKRTAEKTSLSEEERREVERWNSDLQIDLQYITALNTLSENIWRKIRI